jgi:RNA polymerase sigma-70 factor (ECF subfamily)
MAGVDKTQWVEQYRRIEKPLYSVVYRWLWDAAESQDIVQEAFLRCWAKQADPTAESFRALVFRTALNLASNRRRRNKLWRMVGISSVEHELHVTRDNLAFDVPELRKAVDNLPENLKRALLLVEIAGMSYMEAAAALGVREGTVGSRRTRALAMLREQLENEGVTWDEC